MLEARLITISTSDAPMILFDKMSGINWNLFHFVSVIEVPGDVSIAEAVHILAHHNIFSAPVTNPLASPTEPWSTRYLGMVDYPAVIMWVLEQAEIAAAAMVTASTAAVGVGAGAFGALGAVVLGFTGPIAAASLAAAAVGAAIAGMHACMKISDFIS